MKTLLGKEIKNKIKNQHKIKMILVKNMWIIFNIHKRIIKLKFLVEIFLKNWNEIPIILIIPISHSNPECGYNRPSFPSNGYLQMQPSQLNYRIRRRY